MALDQGPYVSAWMGLRMQCWTACKFKVIKRPLGSEIFGIRQLLTTYKKQESILRTVFSVSSTYPPLDDCSQCSTLFLVFLFFAIKLSITRESHDNVVNFAVSGVSVAMA